MKTKILLFLSILLFSTISMAFDHTHKSWTELLKQYQLENGLVKYSALKKDVQSTKGHPFPIYLADLAKVTFKEYSAWTKEQKMSFLINAYNAYTIKLIIDNYPVKSIKKIGGFFSNPWKKKFFSILDGKLKSLDPIEHEWLRPKFKDYRIHAAVNCASISCPPLRREAFVADRLNQQLDEQMKLWLADKTRNRIDPTSKVWPVSKIFDWYGEDFEKWGKGIPHEINKYIDKPINKKMLKHIQIKFMKYNWDLNEAK